MSLNNLSFSPRLLADLYGSVLIEGSASAVPAKKPVLFLGKNGRNILIVVNNKGESFLPDKELTFLTQVLSACQLGLPHVAIVNWQALPEKSATALLEQFNPKQVLLLEVEPAAFNFPITPLYTVTPFQNLSFVVAPSLHKIEKSKEEKKGLWTALKQLFCL